MAKQKINSKQQPDIIKQEDTTNSTLVAPIIKVGRGKITGNGTVGISETVTFDTAFTAAPYVVANLLGYKLTGAYAPASVAVDWGCMTMQAIGASTTGFVVQGRRFDGANATSDTDYYYTWIAIGV